MDSDETFTETKGNDMEVKGCAQNSKRPLRSPVWVANACQEQNSFEVHLPVRIGELAIFGEGVFIALLLLNNKQKEGEREGKGTKLKNTCYQKQISTLK